MMRKTETRALQRLTKRPLMGQWPLIRSLA